MAAILGFEIGQLAAKSNPNPALIGSIDKDGFYVVSQAEVQRIHRRYKQLSANRTDFVLSQRKARQQERLANQNSEANQLTGRPEINQQSLRIFEEMLASNKVPNDLSHQDYLISRGKMYDEKRQ